MPRKGKVEASPPRYACALCGKRRVAEDMIFSQWATKEQGKEVRYCGVQFWKTCHEKHRKEQRAKRAKEAAAEANSGRPEIAL